MLNRSTTIFYDIFTEVLTGFFGCSKKMDEKLIELVRDCPELYDLSNKKYMDTGFKNNIWGNIGKELKLEGNIESQEDEVKEQEHNEEEQSNEQNPVNDENPPIVELETKDESRQFFTPKAYLTTSNKRKKVNASQQSASSQLMEYLLQRKSEPSNSSVRKVDSVDAFLTGIGSTLKTLSPYYLNLAKSEIFQTVQKYELQMITAPAYRSNQSLHGEHRSSSSETPCVSQYPNVTSPCDIAQSPSMYSNTSTRTSTPLSSHNPDVDQQHPRVLDQSIIASTSYQQADSIQTFFKNYQHL
ncbi:hypothetical protein FQR65_LT16837 [Abscondita terminalis]|nr:hypothetical protein FQR65_LT16837 [Abscondita terminalis]